MDLRGSPAQGHERLAKLRDSLRGAWGAKGGATMLALGTAPVARIQRLPFGILMLDWKTRGGLVVGRFNRLWGPKSTLKSTLCLRALRSAQKTCRHCKSPLVTSPDTGDINCRCPGTRFWLADQNDFAWLPQEAAVEIFYGRLPVGTTFKHVKDMGRVPVLPCDAPQGMSKEGKKGAVGKDVVFTEMYRCEPMRALYLDSEQTIDEAWARANGVDTMNVTLIGAQWAEQNLAAIEESILSKDVDFIVIDSTSMLETAGNMEKAIGERGTVAAKSTLMGSFIRRLLQDMSVDGLTARYRPTVLCTSQVTTKGIGAGIPPWLGPTDGNVWEHGLSLDIKMTEGGYTFDSTNSFATYGAFNFDVKKNKAGGSVGATGVIKFWLVPHDGHVVGDSDDLATVMDYARVMGNGYIKEGAGEAKLTIFTPYVREGEMRFGRVGDAERFLQDNPSVYADLRERVLAKLMENQAFQLETAAEKAEKAKK